eukprot:XP_011676045.1 PREDICTED: monocarboxylate transporter 3-like [Strongylocentrotus purpuratus]
MAAPEASEGLDRWRYAVAFAKFIIHVLYSGVPTSLSVLLPSLAYQLDLDHTTVGFLITLEVGMFFFACPISNYLFQKFNPRLVATLGGFLAAISLMAAFFSQTAVSLGCSFFFTGFFSSPLRQLSSITLEQHFGDKYGFAETVTHVGSQLGSFLLPYFTVMCLNAYGTRGALLFLSALMFHCVPMGATMRPPRPQNRSEMMGGDLNKRDEDDDQEVNPLQNVDACGSDENDLNLEMDIQGDEEGICENDENHSNPEADSNAQPLIGKGRANMKVKTLSEDESYMSMTLTAIREYIRSEINASFLMNERVFIYLLLPCEGIYEICYASWAFFSVSYGVSVGIPVEKAVYIVMMESVGGITGRAVLIAVLYKYPLSTPQMLAANIGLAAIGLLAFSINTSLTYLMIFSFVSGFGFFNSFSSFYGFVSIIVKKENFAKAMSYSLMQTGGSLMISGVLTGFLYDTLGSYPAIFRIMGVFLVVDCLAISTFIFVDSRSKQGKSVCMCI